MQKKYRMWRILPMVLSLILVMLSSCFRPAPVPVPDTGQTGDYTDTLGEDSDYGPNAHFYTNMGNGIVRDNVTGLEWVQDGNLIASLDPNFDQDDTAGDGMVTWQHALDYVAKLNGERYLGYRDWRLPTIKELSTLVDAGTWITAIDTTFFPDTEDGYWSSNTISSLTDYAWIVYFNDGTVNGDVKTDNYYHYVRAVRAGQPEPEYRFVDNGDGTVTDTATGLMWQQTTAPGTYIWDEALVYCEGLEMAEYTDWRLPNRNELQSLVDYDHYDPAIDTGFFPDTVASHYWSSTTNANNKGYAWRVGFDNGPVYRSPKGGSNYVRAVRAGQ